MSARAGSRLTTKTPIEHPCIKYQLSSTSFGPTVKPVLVWRAFRLSGGRASHRAFSLPAYYPTSLQQKGQMYVAKMLIPVPTFTSTD